MEASLFSFIREYKTLLNVSQAEKQSGYKLRDAYPPAGFYVYALIDPRDMKIFYVGKGIGGRVLKHEERTRRGVIQNTAKVKRIQGIFAAGHDVARRILFVTESEEVALSFEGEIISQLRFSGLTNIIGGASSMPARVECFAQALRESLDKFRQAMMAE